MSTPTGLGLAGIIPGDPSGGDLSDEEVEEELRALASLGLCKRFYEVIGERVFCFEKDRTTVVEDPKLEAKLLRAWKEGCRGGDLSYDQWGYLWESTQIFIPGARPPRGRVTLPRLGQRSYQSIRGYMYPDPERPDIFESVYRAYNAAYRHKFLFTISG